tara:strand:+ start:385 stop:1134 length:750 start_codon:yes stop_codon:yes gene_type:complete
MVKHAWFNRYDLTSKPGFTRIIQSWDCASKASQLADHSVCTTWGVTFKNEIFLLHVFRARLEYPELKRKVREMAEQFRAGIILIEDTSAGVQLIQELQREGFARIVAIKPQGDKVMRMAAQTPIIEAGRVFIPRDAPWLPDFLHELAMFPRGRFDDQVDSTSQALAFIGAPSSGDGWMDYIRLDTLRRYNLTPEDIIVTFDSIHAEATFTASSGRDIRRDDDGFYHCSRDEWESLRAQLGVKLIEGSEW